MDIQTLLIVSAPALTAIITVISALVTAIKKIKKVDNSLVHINAINAAIMKENAELKKELKKVYKLHSELVEHIAYHDKDNCPVCNKGD